ncbi:MAG: hypothetical protein QOI78_2020 [Actinomycetota bacterium]|jgi:hypothetical protein|nr:hypothetical protein [Actinomycetota bacterium]
MLVTAGLRTINTVPMSALHHSKGRAPRISLVLRKIYFRAANIRTPPHVERVAGR